MQVFEADHERTLTSDRVEGAADGPERLLDRPGGGPGAQHELEDRFAVLVAGERVGEHLATAEPAQGLGERPECDSLAVREAAPDRGRRAALD